MSIDRSLSGCPYDLEAVAEFFPSPPRLESLLPAQGERGNPRLRSTRQRATRAGRRMRNQNISIDDAFPDSASLLVSADDRSGQEVEKLLKVCNRRPGGVGE